VVVSLKGFHLGLTVGVGVDVISGGIKTEYFERAACLAF
jgi:hypothetical protein